MRALKYILKRFLLLTPVLIGVSILTFSISHLVPGNPAAVALGPHATKDSIEALQNKWGLNKPIHIQYLIYVKGLLKGDLGTSLQTNRPVIQDLKAYFPATFELTAASMLLCLIIGIPLGVIAATKKDKLIDHITRIFSLIGVSMPIFWLGLLMLMVFYLKLGLFAGGGRLSPLTPRPQQLTGLYIIDSLLSGNWVVLKDSVIHIIMPAVCLGFAIIAFISRMARSSMLNVLGEDYIKTARAKGLKEGSVVYRHALRNAILPVITVSGALYGQLLAGAILTETIFSWPGMGLYTVRSIMSLDFQPIMGFTIVIAFFYVIINLLVDILYVLFDPRIRLE
jgi:peptide/nickel transport system permease protein